jgi:hypothetical protein
MLYKLQYFCLAGVQHRASNAVNTKKLHFPRAVVLKKHIGTRDGNKKQLYALVDVEDSWLIKKQNTLKFLKKKTFAPGMACSPMNPACTPRL